MDLGEPPQLSETQHEGKQVLLPQHRIMFGILVDVSGSMARTFGLDRLRSVGVKRAHAIITTFLKIIKTEVSRHEREDQIFVSAFGLAGERNNVVTCDLIALLNWLNTVKVPEEMRGKSAHAALISLARKEGYGYAEKWIKEELSWEQAQNLYQLLLIDKSLVKKLLDKLPDSSSAMVVSAGTDVVRGADWLLNKFSFGLFETHMGDNIQRSTVQSSEAYRYAEELIRDKDKIIYDILATMQHSQPKSVQYVLQLFHDLKLDKDDSYATSSNDIHSQIDEILNPIKPYIYGSTPMQKAMTDALDQFRNSRAASKVLFILTDGESTDGDPRMVSEEMKKMDVTVVTCYLTDQHIHDQKRLYDVFYSDSIDGGRKVLFDMSSTMHNIDPPVSYLVSAGWTLPASGESRLYVEANILDIVDELSETVVSQLNKPYDALVDVLNEVDITDMINRSNADFMPDKQDQNPCFAHAVAAVLHLAMHRIVGREGGYPTFKQIRDERLIPMYGKKGAHTTVVLEQVCPEYRLQVKEVDERGARNALNHRRPLVATFALCNDQWAKFKSYYKKTPDGILHKDDIGCESGPLTEHAVVLVRCYPQFLEFMNFWGQDWANGGFFRVKDAQVFQDMTFFDIFWENDDLTPKERNAYKAKALANAQKLHETFPSVGELLFQCPLCKKNSRVNDYNGHFLLAECPKCWRQFKPTYEDLGKVLYLRNM